jgi:hypothetical protein
MYRIRVATHFMFAYAAANGFRRSMVAVASLLSRVEARELDGRPGMSFRTRSIQSATA